MPELMIKNLESMNRHDVIYVLNCFEQMGATEDQLKEEYQRLLQDPEYCHSWLMITTYTDNW